MTGDRTQRIRDILLGALNRSRTDREKFLSEACADDSTLRDDVGRLLDLETLEMGSPASPGDLDATGPTVSLDGYGRRPAGPPSSSDGIALGRYRTIRLLGSGGFGLVYLARDTELDRLVAIKVPHAGRVSSDDDAEQFLAEARTLARLDHPNIVPVHDVGRTPDGLLYFVSRYIDGTDLLVRLKEARPPFGEAAALIAAVSEAAHHAHAQNLVHRDIKPSNILLDVSGRPFLTDFGLALRDDNYGRGNARAGSPSYMSPEQARGEGHRVDGRSDIFSLGVVLYQLLVGSLPFRGATISAVLEEITTREPLPPRQVDETVPLELERVCLKALAKRASERYATAREMAEDLRHYLDDTPAQARPAAPGGGRGTSVVPKGLRSFDERDADFFLDLLPGTRDRDGLPEGLGFWLARIETDDPNQTFRVGMIYGPSGCGKSSFVKAGLLPRLGRHVAPVYVEAATGETEARLLRALRRACPSLPADLGLVDLVASLRRDRPLGAGRKVLIVLDQFEQWLLTYRGDASSGLYSALRQCDGENVQALLLVRDDFWMTATRFMRDLDLELMSDRNLAAIDLFDRGHARKVLAEFGRGYGALPARADDLTRDQTLFLDEAVDGLTRDDKIIPVRLALFAEMVKSKPWTPATLKRVGGADGLGVTFLEETFCSARADPRHSLHQKAAQAVLKALLPESVADIKGKLRPEADLREVSGYGDRPREFEELIHILLVELRLISLADPEGPSGDGSPSDRPREPSYQLTHDYLIRSIRDWLDRKGRATWRGRAGLLLAERAALWDRRRERRQLPSLPEYFYLWAGSRRCDRPGPQAAYLRAAGRHHAARFALLAAGLAAVGLVAWDGYERMRARATLRQLLRASPAEVPAIVEEMAPLRRWIEPMMRAEAGSDRWRDAGSMPIGLSIALLPGDPRQAEALRDRLLRAGPEELRVIRSVLSRQRAQLPTGRWAGLRKALWTDLADASLPRDGTLRAACGLAEFDPDDPRWTAAAPEVVECLLAREPIVAGVWIELLAPARWALGPELKKGFLTRRWSDLRREVAAAALAEYLGDDVDSLVDLAVQSSPTELAAFIPALRRHPGAAGLLDAAFLQPARPDEPRVRRKDMSVRRRADAATALMGLGHGERAVEALRSGPEPTVRSYLIEQFRRSRIDPMALVDLLDRPDLEATARQGLILGLEEYDPKDLPAAGRSGLTRRLDAIHRGDPDPGVHSASGRLLARLRPGGKVDPGTPNRGPIAGRDWFVNGQGQTFAIVRGPFEFTFDPEVPWEGEKFPSVRVGRSFALATTEVTRGQFASVLGPAALGEMDAAPRTDDAAELPANFVSYYDAARFCRRLSEIEGVEESQMCFPPLDRIGEGMELPADYLERTGYRLPTEAEWMAGCYGRSRTFYHFGWDPDLVPHYARCLPNGEGRPGPVARLKPNDLGLFDALGNVYEWLAPFPRAADVAADGGAGLPDEDVEWDLRGGSYTTTVDTLAIVTYRNPQSPGFKHSSVGFRVARTCR